MKKNRKMLKMNVKKGCFRGRRVPDLMTWQSVENEGEEGLFWEQEYYRE
jgi:hypothetical protein